MGSPQSIFILKGATAQGCGTHDGMQGENILGLYNYFGVFRAGAKGREWEALRSSVEEQEWENRRNRGGKGLIVCQQVGDQWVLQQLESDQGLECPISLGC